MTTCTLDVTMPRVFDGRLLRKHREAKGMTETLLAGLAGCSAQNVKNIEHGKQEPKSGLLGRLADALDLPTVDAFFRHTK